MYCIRNETCIQVTEKLTATDVGLLISFWIVSFQANFTFIMLQNKNFIVLLSDQSPGAKIGQKSAAVVNITNGKPIRAVLTATPTCHYFTYTT